MAKDSNNEFGIPPLLFHQVNEQTNGGFILFYYDANGVPRQAATFDSVAHGLGMQKHISNWSDAVNMYSVESIIDQIRTMTGEREEGE